MRIPQIMTLGVLALAAVQTSAQQSPNLLGKPYLDCMKSTSLRYVRGGAPMDLAINTSALKCEDELQDIQDHFANSKSRTDEIFRDATLKGARQAGRIVALDELTSQSPQAASGAPKLAR